VIPQCVTISVFASATRHHEAPLGACVRMKTAKNEATTNAGLQL
jgi:hypothetical protein